MAVSTAIGPSNSSTPQSGRLAFLDVAKGLGILGVVALHSFGRSSRLLYAPYEPGWWVLVFLNRAFAFAVPMFFCISAFLWARIRSASTPSEPDHHSGEGQRALKPVTRQIWLAAMRKRFLVILHPYLVWTIFFCAWEIGVDGMKRASVLSRQELVIEILWGKSYFHLYFLSVLLQAALVFPTIYWLARKGTFLGVCAISFALQAMVFWSQAAWYYLPFPGSCFLWYLTSLLPAAWLGAHWPTSQKHLRLSLWPLAAIALAAGAIYLRLETIEIKGDQHLSYLSNWVLQLYVFGASFWLLALLAARSTGPNNSRVAIHGSRFLRWIGLASLQFYIIHPTVMRLTSGPHMNAFLRRIPGAPLLCYLFALAATFVVVWALNRMGVEQALFGRSRPSFLKFMAATDTRPAAESGRSAGAP